MNEISMTKVYNVTVTKPYGGSETWTFLNYNDRDEFVDYLDELSNDYGLQVEEDSYNANSLNGAKQELNAFLGIDDEDEVDDTDKRTCERWTNGD